VVVEAKAHLDEKIILEIIGKCVIWKLIASRVYVALLKLKGSRCEGFRSLGIGLIEVENGQATVISPAIRNAQLDEPRAILLFKSAREEIMNEHGFLEISMSKGSADKVSWAIPITMKNVGSQAIEIHGILIDGVDSSAYGAIPEVDHATFMRKVLHPTDGELMEYIETSEGRGPEKPYIYKIERGSQLTAVVRIPKKLYPVDEQRIVDIQLVVADGKDPTSSFDLDRLCPVDREATDLVKEGDLA
jgi:hypothetical protein